MKVLGNVYNTTKTLLKSCMNKWMSESQSTLASDNESQMKRHHFSKAFLNTRKLMKQEQANGIPVSHAITLC